MKRLITLLCTLLCVLINAHAQTVVADEGAWCWFADPRALHYENAGGTINATYIGYIDVHGNVKATQYDWLTHRKTDVLVRSYFQPDDHNNPTFVVLPDERVMIFYTRHTDEPCIWYRISTKPGDITALGEEKRLATSANTTYPSPFILSDDPDHIYLCWRGINWHPTIARLTMPDASDNCRFDFGPKQIVQSTGARPYAKYQSNGKDKIYVSYTTGHPDNEMPDWLYFNVIDIRQGNGPVLRDLNGQQLSIINNGPFSVSKTDAYATKYPATIVDKTSSSRNWVWQITLDADENPVIAYPHIDNSKNNHVYWYARWTGSAWRTTEVQKGGHAFHQSWTNTEKCYSGGMAIDPDHVNDLYLSVPTTNGQFNQSGVYEIWKYTIDDEGRVAGSEQITSNSAKNNIRPFIIPGSKNSPLRLAWMYGDYYYWMVRQGYPQGFPTAIHTDYAWQEQLTPELSETVSPRTDCICLDKDKTLSLAFAMNSAAYSGKLFQLGNMTYTLGDDYYPVVTIGSQSYKSQNRLLTSDDWATKSSGTSGDNHPTKVSVWVLTMTYDGQTLTTYRNGLVDQVIPTTALEGGTASAEGSSHAIVSQSDYYAVASPLTVQSIVSSQQADIQASLSRVALEAIVLPAETRTDLVLPTAVMGQTVSWRSSADQVLSPAGILAPLTADAEVTLTATSGSESRQFVVKALARDITKNLRYEQAETLDQQGNTAAGFTTNTFGLAPEGLLKGLRSYTVLVTVNAKTMTKQPRIYDFGSGSANSLFLRAKPLSAGIKYNGATTTMVNGATTLATNTDYQLAVTFDAATHTTRIFVNGVEDASGAANVSEPYQLYEVAADTRNYIGRTQWWDGSYAADNQDFCGTISQLRLYDVALSQREICELQSLPYEQKELPQALLNADFEGTYAPLSGSGVSSDRAIYQPEGWTVDYADRNNNDLSALKSGDLYFSNFFAANDQPAANGQQTYWVRQNWGASTIALKQELRLPAGSYQLTADVWQHGSGGQAVVSVTTEGGTTVTAPALTDQAAWQQASLLFTSDGDASTTVTLAAVHNTNGQEKIIGFDNVVILDNHTNAVSRPRSSVHTPAVVYDLQGRKTSAAAKGVYVVNGRKVVR